MLPANLAPRALRLRRTSSRILRLVHGISSTAHFFSSTQTSTHKVLLPRQHSCLVSKMVLQKHLLAATAPEMAATVTAPEMAMELAMELSVTALALVLVTEPALVLVTEPALVLVMEPTLV